MLRISVQAKDVKLLECDLSASKQNWSMQGVFSLSKMCLARLNEMTDKSKLSVLLTHQHFSGTLRGADIPFFWYLNTEMERFHKT